MSFFKKISVLLAAIASGLILVFWALNLRESFEPPYLLAALNTVFIGAANLLVFVLAARTYLKSGYTSAALMAGATLIMGLGAIFSGWMRHIPDGMNIYATIFNINALAASGLHLAAAFREHRDRVSSAPEKYAPIKLAALIAGSCGFAVFIASGATFGFLPPFHAYGSYTSIRTSVVLIASAVHFSASMALIKSYQRNKQDHLFWYSLSMLMFSLGLLGSGLGSLTGGFVDWAGRLAQYISGVFVFFSVTEIVRTALRRGGGVPGAMSRFFTEAPPLYQNVLEACSYAIVSVDQDFCVLYMNREAEALFKIQKAKVIGLPFGPFMGDQDTERLMNDISRYLRSGESTLSDGMVEMTARDSAGREFPADISVSVHAAQSGCVYTCFIRDITRRVKARMLAEQQTSVLLAINRIYDKAVFCDTHEELARTCLAVAEEVTGSKASFIAEINANGGLHQTIFSAAAEGLSTIKHKGRHVPKPGEFELHGLFGTVVRTGQTIMTNEPASHPNFGDVPEGHMPLTAFIGVPIFNEGQTAGLIGIANREGGYRDEDREMLEALAPTILEVCMRKRAEINARHIAFERTVLLLSQEFINTPLDRMDSAVNHAMEQVALYCGADRSNIYIYDWEEKVIRRLYGWDSIKQRPPGEKDDIIPFADFPEMIEHHNRGDVHFVKNISDLPAHSPYRRTMLARRTYASASFPLADNGRLIGILSLSTTKKPMIWTEDGVTTVEIFCQMIINVLARKDKEQAIREAREREEYHIGFERTMLKLAQSFINTPVSMYRESIINALGVIGDKTGSDRVAIYRFDWEAGVARHMYEWDRLPGYYAGDNLATIAIDKLSEVIEKLDKGLAFTRGALDSPHDESKDPSGIVSDIVFPLYRNGNLYGAIGLSSYAAKIRYEANESLVNIFSEMVSNIFEKIDATIALQEANETNRMILDSTYDGVAMIARDSTVLSAGRVFAAQFGKTPEEMVGTRMSEYTPEDRFKGFTEQRVRKIRRVFDTGVGEAYVDCRDGTWLDTRICPVFKDGGVVAVTLFSTDVTDRKKAEDEAARIVDLEIQAEVMRQRENDYLEMLDGSTDGSWIYDVQHGTIQYSEQWVMQFGMDKVPPEKRLAHITDTLLHPDDRELFIAAQRTVFDNRMPKYKLEYRLKAADGRYVWVLGQCKILYNEDGLPLKVFGTSMDITDRKKTEQALGENELLLRTFMDSASDVMFIKDRDSRVVMVNAAYGRIFDVDIKEIIGKNDYELYGDEELAREVIENDRVVMETGRMLICQESVTTKNGYRTFSLAKVPWRDTHGNILGVLGTAHDITELKNARDELQEMVKSLERSNECIELLYETTERILRSVAPREDIEELCTKVMSFLDCQVFFNYLTNGIDPVLNLNACGGIDEGMKQQVEYLPYGTAVCGSAAQSARRIIAESIQESDDPRTELIKSMGIRSYACHPLLADGQVIGTLAFGTRTRNRFSDEELALMKTVADSIAVAIKRKRSEEALLAATIQLEKELTFVKQLQDLSNVLLKEADIQELFNRIMDISTRIMHSQYASIQMYFNDRENDKKLKLLACRGFNQRAIEFWDTVDTGSGSTCGAALISGQRIVVSDVEECDFISGTKDKEIYLQTGIHAVQTTPLMSRNGQLVGMISTHWNAPYEPSENELRHMDVLARLAADIIERKKAEDSLRENETLLRAIINGANDPVFLKDRQSRLLMANEATAAASGDCLDEILGKTVMEYHKDIECARVILENDIRVMENDRAEVVEEQVSSGTVTRTYLASKTPWHDAQGNVIGLIGVARDITDRIQMEKELRHTARELAEKNALVTDFFINISHEFKTPISVLQLAMEILGEHQKRNSLDKDLLERNLGIMLQNTCRLSKLVGNLLDVTKIDAGFLQPMCAYTDIVKLLKNLVESVKPYAIKRGLHMVFLSTVRSKVILTDAEFVERIVINLLSNAIKHTPQGGVVNVALEENGTAMLLSVRDNGEGVPHDKKHIIFDRYRQVNNTLARSSEGCGIGLSLCKSLAELLGGRIWVESVPGRGSDFFVELPIRQTEGTVKNLGVQPANLQSRIMTEFSDISF